jgi:hypothetical protein
MHQINISVSAVTTSLNCARTVRFCDTDERSPMILNAYNGSSCHSDRFWLPVALAMLDLTRNALPLLEQMPGGGRRRVPAQRRSKKMSRRRRPQTVGGTRSFADG